MSNALPHHTSSKLKAWFRSNPPPYRAEIRHEVIDVEGDLMVATLSWRQDRYTVCDFLTGAESALRITGSDEPLTAVILSKPTGSTIKVSVTD